MVEEKALRQYLSAIHTALELQDDGATFEALLSLNKVQVPGAGPNLARAVVGFADFETKLKAELPRNWNTVISAHLHSYASLMINNETLEAFRYAQQCLAGLNLHLSDFPDLWLVGPLLRVAKDSMTLCVAAQKQAKVTGRIDEFDELIKAYTSSLRESFAQCFGHKTPKEMMHRSRKIGAIALADMIFKLLFRLNTPRQCQSVIGAIANDKFLSAAIDMNGGGGGGGTNIFPDSQIIPYKFYTGKLAVFESQVSKAEEALNFALARTPSSYKDNRRRILEALIPVRLHMGKIPSLILLCKYGLEPVFGGIVAGVKYGHFRAFRTNMNAYQDRFIAAGTYLLLEKLQTFVVRSFIVRASKHLKLLNQASDTTRLNLTLLAEVFNTEVIGTPNEYTMDAEQLEGIVTLLVSRKFIRGYISHKPPVLVTARDRAFPKIADVVGNNNFL